ncbi:MAG: hypothetical protein K1X64_21160 [Myxococcaceae bacterium]|nr:hypothetical protein [Myxococcaceae bacterium]
MKASVVAVLGILLAWPALASTVVAVDIPTLSQKAQSIVIGRVTKVASRWASDKSRVVTDIEVAVFETLKGTSVDKVLLVQAGGTVEDVRQVVHGMPSFMPGEDVFLFLEPRGSARFATVGMAQGKFQLQHGGAADAWVVPDLALAGALLDANTGQRLDTQANPLKLEEMKRQVRQALVDASRNPHGPLTQPEGPTRPATQVP